MDMPKKIFLGVLVSILLLVSLANTVNAESQVCVVYFTGIGCPHCAKADPIILETLPEEYGDKLVVIEYEIYQHRDNIPIFQKYDSVYNTGLGIPLLLFGKDDYIVGDVPIIQNIRDKIDDYLEKGGNPCPMMDGSFTPFDDINIGDLSGSPKIISGDEIQNPVTGEVTGAWNINWTMIGGIMAVIVVIILLKVGVRVKVKVD